MIRPPQALKLLIYGEYFLPVIGGVQTSMSHLASGLAKWHTTENRDEVDHVDVTLVTRSAANGMDDSVFPFPVVRRPGPFRLAGLFRDNDVIHIAGPCLLPLALGWLLRKRVVVEHHGYQAACPNGLLFLEQEKSVCPGHFRAGQYRTCLQCNLRSMGLLGSLRTLFMTFPRRWFCKQIFANITITDLVALRHGLPRSRTIYYGIQPSAASRIESGDKFGRKLQMAYVGRLVPEKGLPVLIEAANLLRDDGIDFHLTLIGDGPEHAHLESLIERFDLRSHISLTGDLRGDDLERAVTKFEVVVMPSVWEETAGLSAIEQMMRGQVVVVADIGGLSEVVGEAGLKFPAGDFVALGACLRRIAEDRQLLVELGQMAHARAMKLFTVQRMLADHLHLYMAKSTLGER